MDSIISIKSADYIGAYKIAFEFTDGTESIVDFECFIKKSLHPDIQKYTDISLFKKFNLEFGDLEWNDYELAFPISDLYQGRVTH